MLPYVPALLSDWRPTHGDERHMRVEGSLAFIDISGFTKLTERLCRAAYDIGGLAGPGGGPSS